MRAVPLEFFNDAGERAPRDVKLFQAVRDYCLAEFGAVMDFDREDRVYVVVDAAGAVRGLGVVRPRWDIPTFHVTRPADPHDEAQRAQAVDARDALYLRLRAYIEDISGRGGTAHVFIHPEAVRLWQSFLEAIGARKAHRFEVPI